MPEIESIQNSCLLCCKDFIPDDDHLYFCKGPHDSEVIKDLIREYSNRIRVLRKELKKSIMPEIELADEILRDQIYLDYRGAIIGCLI